MASTVSEDEDSVDDFSDISQFSVAWDDSMCEKLESGDEKMFPVNKTSNVVNKILNRQLYGRFTKNSKAKTERALTSIHHRCRFAFSSLIKDPDAFNHIFMGFTLCGQYLLSYTEKILEGIEPLSFNPSNEYEVHLWKFVPGEKLKFISKHKIFKHLKGLDVLSKVMFMQFPRDYHKVVCYGLTASSPELVHISILTLPSPKCCKHCHVLSTSTDESINQGWCVKHGFIIHYMFLMSQPTPPFDPNISLAYQNHLVINTGHHIHILNVSTVDPTQQTITYPNLKYEEMKLTSQTPTHSINDTFSEVSESASEHFGLNSVVDAILEDFSEYDLESNECNKPFHELNISCEPLNVTVPQSSGSQKTSEKSKIDKKIAEKAYEFIEENEKYEKISSFRKKRLAEKKYEFSEDNSENIVPFNSLRRERKSSGLRSPMQSPNSRNSSSSTRNLYCSTLRNSPHYSKSPISPRESARKFYVYSPSLDSDCSDSDSRLIMKSSHFNSSCDKMSSSGLLIMDPKVETPKWIRKIVRRYSNGDFENGSLVSGQSRDDYNIPIEIPMMVQNLTEQHFDIVPDFKMDQVTEMQLLVTQRSFDCEQFVQRRAQKFCSEAHLEFLYCEDYDIKIVNVSPINGHISCRAVIKIGALNKSDPYCKPEHFSANFQFSWKIDSDDFDDMDSKETTKLLPSNMAPDMIPAYDIPRSNDVLVMELNYAVPKTVLRDYNNYYEVCLDGYSSDDD